MKPAGKEMFLEGTAISKGIAIGVPHLVMDEVAVCAVDEVTIPDDRVLYEIERYRKALQESRQELIDLRKKLEEEGVNDGVAVLEAHLHITEDPLLNEQMEEDIAQLKKNAEFIFKQAMDSFGRRLLSLSDPFFQQRFEDVQDISKRVLDKLKKNKRVAFYDLPPNSIVFAKTIAPSSAAEAKKGHVAAFVTTLGGDMSHTAIVSKARGIPYVTNVDIEQVMTAIASTTVVIVDGLSGKLIIDPTEKTLAQYRNLQTHIQTQFEQLKSTCSLPTITPDGQKVRLSANVELSDDFAMLHQHGAEGVGLFRSEYLVLQRGSFPSEEEQFAVYKELALHMQGLPVVIRAFDLGMDKVVGSEQSSLGPRAMRFLLKEKKLFYTQLRAVLRATSFGDVRILFPMVSGVNEIREAKAILQEACDDLKEQGTTLPSSIKIGCMVELPSAAIISDILAKECDFFSIGTNDLVQYALAIDRTCEDGNAVANSVHPGVVRLIKIIVREAKKRNIPVSVCGEMASDPRLVPLLLGLGITELSVSTLFLPVIRHVIRSTSRQEAEKLAHQVLALDTAHEIQSILHEYYQRTMREDVAFT